MDQGEEGGGMGGWGTPAKVPTVIEVGICLCEQRGLEVALGLSASRGPKTGGQDKAHNGRTMA